MESMGRLGGEEEKRVQRRRSDGGTLCARLRYSICDANHSRIGAVQQRTAQSQGRVWCPCARQAAAWLQRPKLLRLEPGDLGVNGVHYGLARIVGRCVVIRRRDWAGWDSRGKCVEQMLHELMQPRKSL